jgi:hypothetical protein
MKELRNDRMAVERWKQACKAGSNQSNYRRERGLTETNDDFFVDGVQWADEHPAETQWRSVEEWPKDKEPILMKLSNGKYQYTEWVDDGKGFDSGFVQLNFGGGAMMRLPVEYEVVAWRPLADIINEYVNHGVIATEPDPKADIKAKRLADCELSVRTISICAANDIDTLGDLCRLHRTDWMKFRNGGKKSFFELDDLLHDNGLDWAKA